tara:strand:- start:149997 stop:150797 length:801 start_codon:yes stop_codon:yes gene_type:complete
MNIPPRAKLKSIHRAGRYTCLIAIPIVIAAGIMINAGMYPGLNTNLGFILYAAMLLPIGFGYYLDQKTRIRTMLKQFDELGFQELEPFELEEDLQRALELIKPFNLSFEMPRFATRGLIGDQEVVLLELFTEINDHTTTFTACAAWVPTEWPETTICRRSIKDRLRKPMKLGLDPFDEQRLLCSSDFELASELLLPYARWFITRPGEISSFRMGQPPGKVEQWAFTGNWIVLVDQGSAYAKQHMAMAKFLAAFVCQLDIHDQKQLP